MKESTENISPNLLRNYFRNLVNQFFKILPMKESGEESLPTYMRSLQAELLGCREFVHEIKENPSYMSLLCILEYLIDNPECTNLETRREVFRAISICNKLKALYVSQEGTS